MRPIRLEAGRAAVLVLLAVSTPGSSIGLSQDYPSTGALISIKNGFGTGRTVQEMSSETRRGYAMGVVNGMLVSPLFGAPKDKVGWLERCVERMTDEQVAAIILKYVKDHPERWHHGLQIESWNAMKDACGDR